eukprot:s1085_g5.t1
MSSHLARALQPWQAGGAEGVNPEVLLLAAEADFSRETHSYAVALDYRKAFDSCDYPLALIGLKAMGVPETVLILLENQWKRQVRWVTFAGVTCPEPLELCAGLPQGDCWSPLGLAAVLAAPRQDAARKAPGTECLLYLDDRTLLSTSPASLRVALATWEELAQDKATSVANRIALLPVSLKMRAALCATVFSPIAAWACLLNGRVPDAAERDMCHDCMQPIAPHTKHVLWDCVAHAHLHTVSAPASALAQRLGDALALHMLWLCLVMVFFFFGATAV